MKLDHPMAGAVWNDDSARGRIQIQRDNEGRLMTVHTLWGGHNIQRAYLRAFARLRTKEPCGRPDPIRIGPRMARWVVGPCLCGGRHLPCQAIQDAIDQCQTALPGRSRLNALEFARAETSGLTTYYEREIPPLQGGEGPVARIVSSGDSGSPGLRGSLDPVETRTLHEAVRLGYYDRPRRINMEQLAETLGITKSAVCRRLNKLERTAVLRLLDDPADGEAIPSQHDEWMKVGVSRRSRHAATRALA